MTHTAPAGVLTAILPCNDLDVSERFYIAFDSRALAAKTLSGSRIPSGAIP